MTHSKAEFIALTDSLEDPPLIAFWVEGEATGEYAEDTRTYDWHSHVRGQLWFVNSGLVQTRTEEGSWLLPPHRAGWMPPGVMHTVMVSGAMSGWGVFITPELSACLPNHPCVLGASDLLRELVKRACEFTWERNPDERQRRVLDVLMDEIRHAPRESLHLPMPTDRRLLRIAHAVIEQPQDNRSLEDWADWAAISPRTLSRLFRAQTALSFAQWRQQARLSLSLEQLAEGTPVATVADNLGYANPSAFIAMFRRAFGLPPARYFGLQG